MLRAAATEQGEIDAGVILPPLPDDCRKQEPHAALTVGVEARTALRRERGALTRQNARGARCVGFYDSVAAELATKKGPR